MNKEASGKLFRVWYWIRGFGFGAIDHCETVLARDVQNAVDIVMYGHRNEYTITQVEVQDTYCDPENGMSEYDGELCWRLCKGGWR